MDDNGIIELYWQRSQEAVEQTAEKYGGLCQSIARNILHNEQDAEECVNDTYLRAWNAIPPQRPQRFSAWLGRITRNLSLNRLAERTAKKRGTGEVPTALHELEECVSGAEDTQYDERQIVQAINEFLRGAKPQERMIFVRRYWYLDSVTKIAKLCGLSQSNVTTRLARTRKRLKDYLEQKGFTL